MVVAAPPAADRKVGPAEGSDGGVIVPTGQLVRPAGRVTPYNGRPVDLCLSPDGSRVFVKGTAGIAVIDATTGTILQRLPYPRGDGSMHGIAAITAPDGKVRVYVSGA